MNIKRFVYMLLVLYFITVPLINTVTADGGKDPIDMVSSLRTWASDFFGEFILLICVIAAIIYLTGAASSQMKAKGLSAVAVVIIALIIFYGLPWFAANVF